MSSIKNNTDPDDWFNKPEEIKQRLAIRMLGSTTEGWLSSLEPADIWCAKVLDYDAVVKEEGYKILEMKLKVNTQQRT